MDGLRGSDGKSALADIQNDSAVVLPQLNIRKRSDAVARMDAPVRMLPGNSA